MTKHGWAKTKTYGALIIARMVSSFIFIMVKTSLRPVVLGKLMKQVYADD